MIDVNALFASGRIARELDLSLDDGLTPFFSVSFNADDRIVVTAWAWSERVERWYFSAEYDDGTPIISGQVVELWKDLFRFATTRPVGALVPMSEASALTAPALGELGGRVGVYYFSAP